MKRSPFDEAECGHHYGRAMASWSAILAMTGFHYSAVDQRMSFNPLEGKYFWSNGYQYGTVEMKDHGKHKTVSLNLIKGEFTLNSFMLQGYGQAEFANGKFFRPGQPVEFEVEINR
jgi:non-lysosomal glucosylceramidase